MKNSKFGKEAASRGGAEGAERNDLFIFNPPRSPRSPRLRVNQGFKASKTSQQGMALVIVLAVLVLLTILVVGFLNRATADRTAAAAYFERNHNAMLADQAVNIVQAQIDHASSQTNTAWASQPGMVRTFQQDGSLQRAYKLYSDTSMVVTSVDAAAAVTDLADWASSPAHFVDLNEPVTVKTDAFPAGKEEYPIVDASVLSGSTSQIEGFNVTNAPNATARQPIPMPVRWLYILKDGQAVAPTDLTGKTATIPGASEANPIIGRVAFWTDDETAKLNINTAADGLFWDIPRAFTLDERDRMARFQPALREYQRYPGHPATTSLWPVLGYKVANQSDFGDFVFDLIPRIQQGGSMGGTAFAGATPVVLDNDRLYASVDELLFSSDHGARASQTKLDEGDIEKIKFFLTARSNSPEVNLFNLPRMAIWPINASPKLPSTLDKVIAFCATINGHPYYIERSNSLSPTADWTSRNTQLYDYINDLLDRPFPGFGNRSFVDKYSAAETDQITTEIFDYIRSSNLYSTALGATNYTGTGANPLGVNGSGAGQVAPLVVGSTRGIGRLPVLTQAVFQLYISGLSSAAGTFPSSAYPLALGRVPFYSQLFSSDEFKDPGSITNPPVQTVSVSYESLRKFLNDTGEGNDVQLLTSGIIYFDTFDPMLGYTKPRYKFQVDVEFSGGWAVNGHSLGFEDSTIDIYRDPMLIYNSQGNNWTSQYTGRFFGGQLGPVWMMQNYTYVKGNAANTSGSPATTRAYPLASDRVAIHLPIKLVKETEQKIITVNGEATPKPLLPTLPPAESVTDSVNFSGGTITAKLKVDGNVVQTYVFEFPSFTKPAPTYVPRGYLATDSRLLATSEDLVLKQLATSADFKNRWASQPFNNKKDQPGGHIFDHQANCCDIWLIQGREVVVALEPTYGDKRILAARPFLTSDGNLDFMPNKDYLASNKRIAADFQNDAFGGARRIRATQNGVRAGRILDIPYGSAAMPDVPNRFPNGVQSVTDGGFWPDFDNGTLHTPDDAFVNRADEGSANTAIADILLGDVGNQARDFSWYGDNSGSINNAIFFSPNKQMPSAGMFGSLPTGAARRKPWQTLLFRPDPGGGSGHPGAEAPQDYLFLDLFWMPVVEPYAISEPFSSNGKVNMNYQIMPFGYIHRSTAMRGVLEKQEMVVIPNSLAYRGAANATTGYGANDEYKKYAFNNLVTSWSSAVIHKRLNISETNGTLKTFEDLFAQNKIFRSETEICSVPLIPVDATWSANFESSYWNDKRLTGDNSREMPYTQLLPRLTTKSNTYTVHFRVQSVKKIPATDGSGNKVWNVWNEDRDKVSAEFRGSRTIERYIDPNNKDIPDYAANPAAIPTLDAFYRWRVLHNKTFAP